MVTIGNNLYDLAIATNHQRKIGPSCTLPQTMLSQLDAFVNPTLHPLYILVRHGCCSSSD